MISSNHLTTKCTDGKYFVSEMRLKNDERQNFLRKF